jgi:hypothetical protein
LYLISQTKSCCTERYKTTEDTLKEQRAIAYQALEEHWMCRFNMKTSQKAHCYPDLVKDGYCCPLTKDNLGY